MQCSAVCAKLCACVCFRVWSHLLDKNCPMHRHKLSLSSSHSTQEMWVWIFHFLSLVLGDSQFICHFICIAPPPSFAISLSLCPNLCLCACIQKKKDAAEDWEEKLCASVDDRSETRKGSAKTGRRGWGMERRNKGRDQLRRKRMSEVEWKSSKCRWFEERFREQRKLEKTIWSNES